MWFAIFIWKFVSNFNVLWKKIWIGNRCNYCLSLNFRCSINILFPNAIHTSNLVFMLEWLMDMESFIKMSSWKIHSPNKISIHFVWFNRKEGKRRICGLWRELSLFQRQRFSGIYGIHYDLFFILYNLCISSFYRTHFNIIASNELKQTKNNTHLLKNMDPSELQKQYKRTDEQSVA